MTATLWLWAACLVAAAVLAAVAWSLATDRGRHVRVRIDGLLLFTAVNLHAAPPACTATLQTCTDPTGKPVSAETCADQNG